MFYTTDYLSAKSLTQKTVDDLKGNGVECKCNVVEHVYDHYEWEAQFQMFWHTSMTLQSRYFRPIVKATAWTREYS